VGQGGKKYSKTYEYISFFTDASFRKNAIDKTFYPAENLPFFSPETISFLKLTTVDLGKDGPKVSEKPREELIAEKADVLDPGHVQDGRQPTGTLARVQEAELLSRSSRSQARAAGSFLSPATPRAALSRTT
jgi:hypothetical protein